MGVRELPTAAKMTMAHNVFVLTAALLCAINVTASYQDITAPASYEGDAAIVWDSFANDHRRADNTNGTNGTNGTIAPTGAPTAMPTVAGGSLIISFTVTLSGVSVATFETPPFKDEYVETLATGLTNATGVNISTSQIFDVKATALRRAAGISVSQKISLPPGTASNVATDFATMADAYLATDFVSQLTKATGINVGNVTVTSAPTVSGLPSPSSSSSGLSTGLIVVIVLASVVGLSLIGALVYYFAFRNAPHKSGETVVMSKGFSSSEQLEDGTNKDSAVMNVHVNPTHTTGADHIPRL